MVFLKDVVDLNDSEESGFNPFSAFFCDEEKEEEPTLDEVIEQVIEEAPAETIKEEPEENTVENSIEEQFEEELKQELTENKELQSKIEKTEDIPEQEEVKIEEPEASVEEVKEEAKSEPETEEVGKKPKKRGRKKGAKKEDESEKKEVEESSDEVVEFEDVQGGKVASLDEAASILNIESDEEFEKFRKEITEKVNNIYITSDINPTSVGIAVEAIDSLMVDVMEWYWRTKTIYDNLTNDKDGKLTVVRSLNKKGSNPDERARNSYLALKNYKLKDNTTIDLLDTVYSIRYKYTFISNVFDRLKMKKELLVTMTAKLKMEQ